MASLYHPVTHILLDVTSRRTISASFSRSAIPSSLTLSAGHVGTSNAAEIFDIFDAPAKLGERSEPSKTLFSPSATRVTSGAVPSHSRSVYDDALGLPLSLPPPVTFDGPACPPHIPPSTLNKRRLQRQSFTPSSRGVHGSSTVSCGAPMPRSQPLYQLFDGPSRITPYPYPTLRNERPYFAYASLVVCLSGAFGWLAFKDTLDLQRK